jgi:hypothetical protein
MQNSSDGKQVMEKTSSNNLASLNRTAEKVYSLQGFMNKINKSDQNTWGNFYVDFSEMFTEQGDSQKYLNFLKVSYMKKHVSLQNNMSTEKKSLKNLNNNYMLKESWFGKFTIETLFYIFYYMPKDSLQLIAAEELYKRKWRYHTDYSVWFTMENKNENEKNEKIGSESFLYFNSIEWKIMKFTYGLLNPKGFLPENEVLKYKKSLNIEK